MRFTIQEHYILEEWTLIVEQNRGMGNSREKEVGIKSMGVGKKRMGKRRKFRTLFPPPPPSSLLI